MRQHALVVADVDDGVALFDVAKRRVRAGSLRVARRLDWVARPRRYPVPRLAAGDAGLTLDHLAHLARVPMRRHDPGAHELLEQGKCVNVALAAPSLHGVVLDPGRPFSFWRAVGPPTAALGYRHGIEVRGGCVVPSIGGGLCLLTNALFRAAAEMNWVILERHGHTLEAVPSADEPWGVDATAAWPYIDLRFAVPRGGSPARLGVRVDGDVLVVEVWTVGTSHPQVELMAADDRTELIEGHRIRSNRIVRRSTDELGVERVETIAVNTKRLLDPSDLARNCLTCDLTGCAGRVTVP